MCFDSLRNHTKNLTKAYNYLSSDQSKRFSVDLNINVLFRIRIRTDTKPNMEASLQHHAMSGPLLNAEDGVRWLFVVYVSKYFTKYKYKIFMHNYTWIVYTVRLTAWIFKCFRNFVKEQLYRNTLRTETYTYGIPTRKYTVLYAGNMLNNLHMYKQNKC